MEAHLLDFSGDLYGQHLVLEFVAHLRPEMRFPGIDALREHLVDMNQLVEIWKSKPIPEGPIVLRKALPERVKIDIATLTASLPYMDADCAYNFMAGEALGFQPIDHDAYLSIIEARKSKM